MDMYNKVQEVNELLAGQGAAAVQKFAKIRDTGRDIYGYQPQKVFDAMNKVFGADGWAHTIVFMESTDTQIIARIGVTLGGRTCEQFGEHRIMKSDKGSACKSAVTDGIQKALSLFGVGAKAYRGELKDVFDGKVSQTETDDDFETLKEEATEASNIGLEESRAWWRQNLIPIQFLTKEQRGELVEILGNKK
jgi:hypothetical protein